jgi:hypothetical protein
LLKALSGFSDDKFPGTFTVVEVRNDCNGVDWSDFFLGFAGL